MMERSTRRPVPGIPTADDHGFPSTGENFRTVNEWTILSGSGWERWKSAALSAEIAASRSLGDELTALRQRRASEDSEPLVLGLFRSA